MDREYINYYCVATTISFLEFFEIMEAVVFSECNRYLCYIRVFISLFHMKITASVTKSSHQDCGRRYLHLPIFFLYILYPVLLENKKVVVIAVFLSKLDHRPLFNDIYYETILV